jgi:hypothetical protein
MAVSRRPRGPLPSPPSEGESSCNWPSGIHGEVQPDVLCGRRSEGDRHRVPRRTVTITFTSTSTRYLRLNVTANTGESGGQASEFEVVSF